MNCYQLSVKDVLHKLETSENGLTNEEAKQRRLKKKFDEKNIEIPFPHVTLYMEQNKQGQSPPLHIVKENK